jgi:transcriptional regulator with XRE-family HTH domain
MTRGMNALATWMRATGKNQACVAKEVGERLGRPELSQTTISRIQRGTVPHGDIMSALNALAGIEVAWWTERLDESSTRAIDDVAPSGPALPSDQDIDDAANH